MVNNPSVSQLLLPSFVVYSPLDEKLQLYKKTREEIIELYNGKDFKELTLKLLSDSERSLTEVMNRQTRISFFSKENIKNLQKDVD